MSNVFEAEFFRDFCGPDGKLFLDAGDKIRLAFSLNIDFFYPNGMHSITDEEDREVMLELSYGHDLRRV